MTLTNKIEKRDAAEIVMKLKIKELSRYNAVETEARSDDSRTRDYSHSNHIESETLKSHKITRSYYHGGNSQGNEIRLLIAKGLVFFMLLEGVL